MKGIGAILLCGLLTNAGPAAAVEAGHQRLKHQPMSAAERAQLQLPGQRQGHSAAVRRAALSDQRPTEPVLLLLERSQDKATAGTQADAYYYDYRSDETTHIVLDLRSGEQLSVQTLVGIQLPLIQAEVERAFGLVWNHPRFQRELARAYSAATGALLNPSQPIPEQVSFKAFVFHPDTVPLRVGAAGRNCGVQRCAQLLVYTTDNVALNFSPLVNLSTGKVLQNLEGDDHDAS